MAHYKATEQTALWTTCDLAECESRPAHDNKTENGALKTWSLANKIAAAAFVLMNTAAIIWLATHKGKF